MIIELLELQNFRNYETERIQFDEKTNIFFGDNAQGKTNILEAIYMAGTTKSHKQSKDAEMIRFGMDEAHIKAIVHKKEIEYRIDLHLRKQRSKGIAVNGVPIRKSSDLFGIVNLVFFSPEDLSIIKSGPAGRRKFMDMELCQLNPMYVQELIGYNKVLNQRNQLLKDLYFNPSLRDTLEVWDNQLCRYGCDIIGIRQNFIQKLDEIIGEIHRKLTGGKEELHVTYEPNVREQEFARELEASRIRDEKLKTTNVGPHRDDILFTVGDIDIRKYGSQGQQRTAALSLKLAEIELVKEVTGDTPILLLDDVLSELDHNRQNYLLDSIHDIQTIITCTGLDEFVKNRFQINRVYQVTNGHVDQTLTQQ